MKDPDAVKLQASQQVRAQFREQRLGCIIPGVTRLGLLSGDFPI